MNRYRREKLTPRRRAHDLSKCVTALASNENRDDVRLLAAVVRQMMRRFGGFDRMCAEWAYHVKALAERRPGGRLVIKTFQALAHILIAVQKLEESEYRAERARVQGLTESELLDLVTRLAR